MEGLQEFISIINKVLPGAWGAAVRQAYINGSLFIIAAVISGIMSIGALFKLRSSNDAKESDGITAIIMFFTALFSIVFLVLGVMYLINPEYHAIQMLKP